MDKLKILFTAGGSPVHEALYKQLKNCYDLYFADVEPKKISPSIPIDKKIKIPFPGDDDYISLLKFITKKLKIDLLVPGVDEELQILQKNFQKFLPCELFLPNADFVSTMLDKYKMNLKLKELDISVPLSIEADQEINNFKYPIILKPKKGRGSRDIFTFFSKNNLRHFLLSIRNDPNEWIIQEKLDGKEYTVQVFSTKNSALICILPIRVVEKRGSTISAFIEDNKNIINYCRKIHEKISPGGCYNIQLFENSNGQIGTFEINPRISTTFCLGIEAGFDPFKTFLDKNVKSLKHFKLTNIYLERHYVNYFSKSIK